MIDSAMMHGSNSRPLPAARSGEPDGAQPLRVLHLCAPAPMGGLERVVEWLAGGQAARGHQVHVAAVLDEGTQGHPILEAIRGAGVEGHALALPSRAYLREYRAVRELCGRIAPDVVHSHGYRCDVVGARAARAAGAARISTVHGFTRGGWRNRLYERLQRRAWRSFDAVTAVSAAQVSELIAAGVPADRVRLIPNAWVPSPLLSRAAARSALQLEEGVAQLGWVGRLTPEKAPELLLEALALLAGVPVAASFIGSAARQPELAERARTLGQQSRVHWHGSLPDAAPLYPAFDIFVLTSRTEGIPIVLFEAMAASVPIIATRVGGVPDVLSAREALLVESGDAEGLANAIRDVLADTAGARARADAARIRLEREFGAERWLARYDDAYHEILAARR